MTSQNEVLKTNEYLRRRKLRIQQVREQSKEIAKKIRQRAKVEQLRNFAKLDKKKQEEYFQKQDQFVQKLEEIHVRRLQNVGAGHQSASEINLLDDTVDDQSKVDLSKKRGREAAAELRRRKQEKLDQQKKLLDRKLHAREVANEISREKSSSVATKLQTKPTPEDNKAENPTDAKINRTNSKDKIDDGQADIVTNEMATQWDFEEIPEEWEPHVPRLSLPKDLGDSKDSGKADSRPDQTPQSSKQHNLFALSEEMPSCLRGGRTHQPEGTEINRSRPSLTYVSEYLKNRELHLRETDKNTSKKPNEDLQSLKETIHRSRAARVEGSSDACHVADVQVIPVPSWQAQDLPVHVHKCSAHRKTISPREYKSFTNDDINKIFRSIRPLKHDVPTPTPVLRGSSPFRRTKMTPSFPGKCNVEKEKPTKLKSPESLRRNAVTTYNHSTRDTKDVPRTDRKLVIRDYYHDEDAYSQAIKETSVTNIKDKELKKHQDTRSRVAVTKQNVEKEFKDTMAFLNSLPKDGSKPIKDAHMGEHRRKLHRECRQRKLQHEFKKVERECRTDSFVSSTSKPKCPCNSEDDSFEAQDFQYSWMPVPESDAKLAVHTIPTRIKEGKSGNSVKFSKVDSYHEYRSRHKHTPPTKDTTDKDRLEQSIEDKQDVTESSSTSSDTSSVENLSLYKDSKPKTRKKVTLTDAETIIVYKVLKSKDKGKKNSKLIKELVKSLSATEKESIVKSFRDECAKSSDNVSQNVTNLTKNTETKVTIDTLNEGIYRTMNEQGDNIAALKVPAGPEENVLYEEEYTQSRCVCDKKRTSMEQKGASLNWVCSDTNDPTKSQSVQQAFHCTCSAMNAMKLNQKSQPTIAKATSASSYATAVNKATVVSEATLLSKSTVMSDGAGSIVKLLNEEGQETGKFIIGASGLLQDEAYELIIQLRKKLENDKIESNKESSLPPSGNASEEITDSSDQNQLQDKAEMARNTKTVAQETEKFNEQAASTQIHQTVKHAFSQTEDLSNKKSTKQCNVPETSEADPKRPTSTCTQTSMEIPDHHFHMSSSTSTAYMSPPDRILPGLCKRRVQSEKTKLSEDEEFAGCKCRRCSTSRQRVAHRSFPSSPGISNSIIKTPPNTARTRSTISDGGYDRTNFIQANKKNIHIRKRMCENHNRPKSKTSLKSGIRGTSSASLKKTQRNINKTALNPIVKTYVDKLLVLNKKSLQAIEVMNEDCSAVTTPGSSVVNVPRNTATDKKVDNKISLEQIKQVMIQQILNKYATLKESSAKAKEHKTRPLHRVKSLNISKHVLNTSKHSVHKPSQPAQSENLKYASSSSREESTKTSPSPRSASPVHLCKKRSASKSKLHSNVPPKPSSVYTPQTNGTALTMSTQTNIVHNEANFMQLAENKLQNMEKIADLTEKCTKRLSNLAKVLEDIRKNKMLAYSQISDSASESDRKSEQDIKTSKKSLSSDDILEAKNDAADENNRDKNKDRLSIYDEIYEVGRHDMKEDDAENNKMIDDIFEGPRNDNHTTVTEVRRDGGDHVILSEPVPQSDKNKDMFVDYFEESSEKDYPERQPVDTNDEEHRFKLRDRPPPASLKSKLLNYIVPHELSTVVEVDSPLSVHNKNQSSTNCLEPNTTNAKQNMTPRVTHSQSNPDLVQSNFKLTRQEKTHATSSDDSKLQMMDIQDFNEIMLKPFIGIREYANQRNIGIDEISNITEMQKDKVINDELSSQSEASLPDVIAELLKRNVIKEPFKFDTPSNMNSTSISSESTLSMLALSKLYKGKKKSRVMFEQKENIAETSDTLSISSNPDLENAFKKMGLGWASSTLRKTKERLALSSSSNSSSTSSSHFKVKSSSNQEIPVIVSDSVSSVINLSRKSGKRRTLNEISRNAEQQTSTLNSMTVKEFLTNELAKKITFTNKSHRDDTEEFVSLFETKMPEEMRHSLLRDERSVDSGANRARTSTPVQLFKSTTYRSSSSSNISNGLFSNAEDLSSVKGTSNSQKNRSASDREDLTIPDYSLRKRKGLHNGSD